MNSKVLSFVNKLEGYKTAIKSLHWDSDNMSQHELCDKIADAIAEFQDTVSEVEQSITGNLDKGKLKPEEYNVTTLKKFVEDVLDATNSFYKSIENEGDSYTGMRSDCESFLSDMQRNLYLVGFTMKEDLKRRLAGKLNEGFRKEENIKTTFHGTKPSTEKGVLKRINDLTKNGQLNTRVFAGINEVLDFYRKILGNIGRLRCIDACAENNYLVKLETESGWKYYGLLRVKDVNEGQCKASITFSPHGDEPEATDVEPQQGGMPIEDENNYEVQMGEGVSYTMTSNELKGLVKESVRRIVSEITLRHRPTPEMLEHPRIPRNQKIKGEAAVKTWLERYRRTYTDPDYFAEQLRRDHNFKDALVHWGLDWVEEMFPGNENVRKTAEEVLAQIERFRAYKETDEYKQKKAARQAKDAYYRRKYYQKLYGDDEDDGGMTPDYGERNDFTPFFDPDMGWH